MAALASIVVLCLSGPVMVVGPAEGRSPARALVLPIEVGYRQAREVPGVVDVVATEVVATPAEVPGAVTPAGLLMAMEAAYRGVRDYTATLMKQERVKGKLLPRETIAVKFRRPYAIYMKWTGAVKAGQEVIYVRGRNDGKLSAHPGKFPDITVSL